MVAGISGVGWLQPERVIRKPMMTQSIRAMRRGYFLGSGTYIRTTAPPTTRKVTDVMKTDRYPK